MIFLSLSSGIRGGDLNHVIGKISEGTIFDGYRCTKNLTSNSFEFVPRVSERYYRSGYELFFKKGKREYMLKIIPFNTALTYHEIGIIPYAISSLGEFTELYCDDINARQITILCTLLVLDILKESGLI